jgi:ribosomal-protein-alanine N-acetyltransferase
MQPEPHSQSHRVSLRPVSTADSRLLDRWRLEPSVRRHQPLSEASLAQLQADLALQDIADLYRGRGDKFQWIVLFDSRPVGWITLVITNWSHGLGEIGYALSTPYQRLGIMPRALELLLEIVFVQTRLRRIEARCSVDNKASYTVLERVGFSREGRLRSYFVLHGEPIDNYLYAILRQDYEAVLRGIRDERT